MTEKSGGNEQEQSSVEARPRRPEQLRSKVAERLFGARAIPTHVGALVVLRELAAGGFERAFLAYDLAQDQKVELLLCPASIAIEDAREKAASLSEILGVKTEAVVQDRRVYIVVSLSNKERALSEIPVTRQNTRELLGYWTRAGEILCRAHLAGIVHGRFSVDSVKLSRSGRVSVRGFRCLFFPSRRTDVMPSRRDEPRSKGSSVPTSVASKARASSSTARVRDLVVDSSNDCFEYCSAIWRYFGGELSSAQASKNGVPANAATLFEQKPALPGRVRKLLEKGLTAGADCARDLLPAIVAGLRREGARARIITTTGRFAAPIAIFISLVLPSVAPRNESSCGRLVSPWAMAEQKVLEALSRSGSPVTESAGLIEELKAYISKGRTLHYRACVQGEALPRSAPADLDAVSACYFAAADSVVSFRDRALQSKQRTPGRLVSPSAALTPLESCLDRNMAATADLREFEAVENLLAQSRLRAAFQDFKASLALAKDALERLSDEKHASRFIRALLLQARSQNALGDTLDARQSVDLAYFHAERHHNRSLRLRAAVLRSKIMLRQGKHAASVSAMRDAWPLVQKDDVSTEAKFEFLSKACLVDRRDMNCCESFGYCRDAVDLIEREGLSVLHLSEIERRMAWIRYESGRVEEAVELATRAQKRVGEYAGRKSVFSLEADALLASLTAEWLRESGSDRGAYETLQNESEGIYARYLSAYGSKNYLVGIARTNLAEISRRAGKLLRAKLVYEEQLSLCPEDAERYFALVGYGKVLIELGQKEAGVEKLLAALSEIESIERESLLAGGEPRIPEHAEALLALSKAIGNSPEALDFARRARALYFELNRNTGCQAQNCVELAGGAASYAHEYKSADSWIKSLLASTQGGR